MPDEIVNISDRLLEPIRDRVVEGIPLSVEDGIALYASRDVHGIGRLANFVRESLHGDQTFYNRNRHINYTNVCALELQVLLLLPQARGRGGV